MEQRPDNARTIEAEAVFSESGTAGSAFVVPGLTASTAPEAAPPLVQAQATAGGEGPISVENVRGEVLIIGVDGRQFQAAPGQKLSPGDVVMTQGDGALEIGLTDGTRLFFDSESRVLIEEPAEAEAKPQFFVIQGEFSVDNRDSIEGPASELLVRTPVASVTVKGARMIGKAAPEAQANTFVLLPNAGGAAGALAVATAGAVVTLDQPLQGLQVLSLFREPTHIPEVDAQLLTAEFGDGVLAYSDIAGDFEIARTDADGFFSRLGEVFGITEAQADPIIEGGEAVGDGDSDTDVVGDTGEDELNDRNDEDEIGNNDGGDDGDGVVDREIDLAGGGNFTETGGAGDNDTLTVLADPLNANTVDIVSNNGQVLLTLGNGGSIAFTEFETLDVRLGSAGDTVTIDNLGDTDISDNTVIFDLDAGNDSLDAALIGKTLNVDAGEGDDTVVAGDRNDVLDGGAGNDSLTGNAGDDTIDGGDRDDIFAGGAGDDLLIGGDGTDRAQYSGSILNFNASVDETDGRIFLTDEVGTEGADTLAADIEEFAFADVTLTRNFDSSANDDAISAGAGDNAIAGLAGDDSIAGEDGIDIIFGGSGNDTLDAGGGEFNELIGDAGNDVLAGGSGVDFLFGGDGDDTMTGGAGDDLLSGGAGEDIAAYAGAIGGFNLGFSDDGAFVFVADQSGSEGSDTISSDVEQFDFAGDVFSIIGGTADGETLPGTAGRDLIVGLAGDDSLTGIGGNDLLAGGVGNDTLDGGAGDDTLQGSDGDDSLIGGDGIDTADFSDAGGAVNVDLSDDTVEASGDGNDTLSGIENIVGGAQDDSLTGDAAANLLAGGGGADTITGGGGDDTLEGGTGADTITGGEGDDTLVGGAGRDSLFGGLGDDVFDGGSDFDTASFTIPGGGAVSVDMSEGGGSGTVTGQGTDSLTSIERVFGSTGDDTFTGSDDDENFLGAGGDDLLIASLGNDTLNGAGDNDTVDFSGLTGALSVDLSLVPNPGQGIFNASLDANEYAISGIETVIGTIGDDRITGDANANRLEGGQGADSIDGGVGADTLLGGAGNDTLLGGAGADTLTGGDGADRFQYDQAIEHRDVITDFVSDTDKFLIDRVAFEINDGGSGTLTEDQNFVTLDEGETQLGTTEATFIFDSNNTLHFDPDGDGAQASFEIASVTVSNGTLQASDFEIQ